MRASPTSSASGVPEREDEGGEDAWERIRASADIPSTLLALLSPPSSSNSSTIVFREGRRDSSKRRHTDGGARTNRRATSKSTFERQ
eukprot:scaffold16356_cov35-Tisochrysis_lutea.AAC.1